MITAVSLVGKGEVSALLCHQLAGESETYSCAGLLCGIERNEDVSSDFRWYRRSVVADVEGVVMPRERYCLCICFHGVLDDVDAQLSDEGFVHAYACRGNVDRPFE